MKKPAAAGFFAQWLTTVQSRRSTHADQTICALSRLTPAVELKPQST